MTGAYLYELGVTPYGEALGIMTELAGARSQGAIPDTVMLLEHEPVITLGSRQVLDLACDLLLPPRPLVPRLAGREHPLRQPGEQQVLPLGVRLPGLVLEAVSEPVHQ